MVAKQALSSIKFLFMTLLPTLYWLYTLIGGYMPRISDSISWVWQAKNDIYSLIYYTYDSHLVRYRSKLLLRLFLKMIN